MKVYHGSYTKIDKIDLSKCEPRKDFGQGFYVTKFYKQAIIWANRKGRYHNTKGVVTEFTFFESVFNDKYYKTLQFNDYNDEWLDFVTLNRNFNTPLPSHDFDIVEGPVADDKITTRIDAYIRGEVSKTDNCLHGRVLGLNKNICIIYEGNTADELYNDFIDGIDHYLNDCKEDGIVPNKPYNGLVSINLPSETHFKVVTYAKSHGTSIDDFVNDLIEERLEAVC